MTSGEQARMTRNSGLCTFLTDSSEVYLTDQAFKTFATKMMADSATAVTSAAAAAANNKGYSADKTTAKIAVCTLSAQLCSSSQVKFNLLDNQNLSQALNGNFSFYYSASDAVCLSFLNNVYTVMDTNLALLTPDYLTAAQLTTFLTKINTFATLAGTTTNVNSGSTVLTKQFKADLKVTNADVVVIKKLAKGFKTTQNAFHSGLLQACKIPAISVRHTTVNVTVTDTQGVPLNKVSGTLTKTAELPISNVEGIVTFTTVPAGHAVGTFTLQDYTTVVIDMVIKSGKTNEFTLVLKPNVVSAQN